MPPHRTPATLRALSRFLRSPPVSRQHSTTSSVSPSEVSHFQNLASSWWDPHGPSRLLHLMNPLRHSFIKSCHNSVSPYPPTQKLKYLDIGCGGGIFAESAARLSSTSSVTAIDPTPGVVKIAEEHARRDPSLAGKLRYLNQSIEGLEKEEQVDVLALWEVIEHVEYPSKFLEECTKHVKPGGWIVGSTIARTWTSWLTTKVVAEDLLSIVPRGTHEWGKYINPEELRGWFGKRAEQWEDLRVEGCVYVPGFGWKVVSGAEGYGNYFFSIRKRDL